MIRWTAILSVVVLAVIAALVSYRHMYLLVRRYGETSWTAVLLPISVDGMIVTSSMSLLMDSRCHRRSGPLPWVLLLIGSAASLAANVAVAEPSVVGRLIAAWPSCALIGSYELLMRQVRNAVTQSLPGPSEEPHTDSVTDGAVPDQPAYEATTTIGGASFPAHTDRVEDRIASYEAHTIEGDSPDGSYELQRGHTEHPDTTASPVLMETSERAERTPQTGGGAAWGLQQRAWQWTLANQEQSGHLPTGKAIAEQFGRCERWGRLVKQAGLNGRFDSATRRPGQETSAA
ncbi:DUF2637 domain-containing protein [Actinoallomurus liliacearum]|uniref:DUF2637 domain-containing protein n=1 Tax=Actinoallomurus liliacearum TaxID=1080073 RepID=UPI0031E97BF8